MTSPNPMRLPVACANCPFRSDRIFYIDERRKQEIADSLRRDEIFNCHKTIRYGELATDQTKAAFCAGALKTMINEGLVTSPMQIAERLGLWDLAEFVQSCNTPVFDSLQAWIETPLFAEGNPCAAALQDSSQQQG